MKPQNLISIYKGAIALNENGLETDKKFKTLKDHEIRNLQSLWAALRLYWDKRTTAIAWLRRVFRT